MDPKEHHHSPHDHERTDVQAPVLSWMALALALFLLVSLPAMVGVFSLLKWEDKSTPPPSPLAKVELPPAPRLQPVPSTELEKYRAAQTQLLTEYDWIDRQQKIVRIPVDEAMRLLVERGLPKAPPQPAAAPEAAAQPATPSAATPPAAPAPPAAQPAPPGSTSEPPGETGAAP